jgi:transposase
MPPAYVKPYVKRGKTDAVDAEAICEAVTRPTMRFVPVKSAATQAALLDHKTRDFLVRQRTQIINAIRAHVGEFGIVVAKGIQNAERLIAAAQDAPEAARPALDMLAEQLAGTQAQIDAITARIGAQQTEDLLACRLATIPGVGTISSSAFAATTPDVNAFRSGRDYAAWLGLRSVSRTDRVPARSPESAFQRGQRAARADLEGWQPVSATAALPWCHGKE